MGEIGYCIGVLLGDGYLSKPQYETGLIVKDKNFAIKFATAIEKITTKKPKFYSLNRFAKNFVARNGCPYSFKMKMFYVRLWSKEWFMNFLEMKNNWTNLQKEELIDVVNGFFDSEGTITRYKSKKYFYVGFYNSDKILLEKIKFVISSFGINNVKLYHLEDSVVGRKPMYRLTIYKQNEVKKFCETFKSLKTNRMMVIAK